MKPKLSKDEAWLEMVFKANFDKLDKNDQEGGKNRKAFLKELGEFRSEWEQVYSIYTDIIDAKWETDKQKKDREMIVKSHDAAEKAARALDLGKAFNYAKTCRTFMDMIMKREAPKVAIAPSGRNYRNVAGGVMSTAGMVPRK